MRTTLDIEDDLLEIAKSIAQHQNVNLGKAVSLLIRKGLSPTTSKKQTRNGLRILNRPQGSKPVTLEIINQLRDEIS